MTRILYYLFAALLGLFGTLGALRFLEVLVTHELNSFNIGRLTGTALFSLLFLYGAYRILQKARKE